MYAAEMTTTFQCTTCQDDLPLTEFHANKRSKRGHKTRCKDCTNGYSSEWFQQYDKTERKLKARDSHLRRTFGVSAEEFDQKLADQGGVCPICGFDEPRGHNWNQDHDHDTGKNRDILCFPCNTGLGKFGEDPARLEQAAAYLRKHGK